MDNDIQFVAQRDHLAEECSHQRRITDANFLHQHTRRMRWREFRETSVVDK